MVLAADGRTGRAAGADFGEVMKSLHMSSLAKGGTRGLRPPQILPLTSFCIRLAISTSRRHACSRNDIMRSMSRSLGSGISILRSPSADLRLRRLERVRFRQRLVDLARHGRLARRQFRFQLFVLGLQPADFRINAARSSGTDSRPSPRHYCCRSKRRRSWCRA